MEYTSVTSATARGFMKKSLEIPPSGDSIRRGQLDPDAGRTGAVAEAVRYTTQAN